MALLSCEKVCFAYESGHVCENIDFELSEGDYLCIVGENGAGKSTRKVSWGSKPAPGK